LAKSAERVTRSPWWGDRPYAPGLGTVGRGLGRHLCVMRAQPKLNLGPILLYLFYLLPV